VTKLSNGIRVLTESVSVPSTVQLGVFVDYGSRDESNETSGAMLSLKNTYLKTAINTSETVNYGITQMSGGEFEMDYNRENAYYRASCLAHDVVDVFSMVADSAFEPKNYVSTSVGMYKNSNSHKLETFLGSNEVFTDSIFQAAYGRKGLGMPIQGLRSNVNYLTAHVIQKFQAANLTPDRIVISAAGVEAHEEFVDVVNEKLALTILPNKQAEREAAKYVGGEVRNLTEANNIHIVLAFEGANHSNSLPLLLAEELLGNGRKLGRIQKNILNKHVFIDGAQTLNSNFADTGLFGLKLSGSAAHVASHLFRPRTSSTSPPANWPDSGTSLLPRWSSLSRPSRAASTATTTPAGAASRRGPSPSTTSVPPTNKSPPKSTHSPLPRCRQQWRPHSDRP
jgi:processing peptidase subunit beta